MSRGPDLLGGLDGSAGSLRGPQSTRPETGPTDPECSRRGCREDARWRLEWNNPRIHAPERRKTWLACPAHRDWLADYLQSRGLLRDVQPLEAPEGRP